MIELEKSKDIQCHLFVLFYAIGWIIQGENIKQ